MSELSLTSLGPDGMPHDSYAAVSPETGTGVQVEISIGEEIAAGLSSVFIFYPNSTARQAVADNLLLVSQGEHILTEFPVGRYVGWIIM